MTPNPPFNRSAQRHSPLGTRRAARASVWEMRKPAIVAEKSSGNVFADLGLPNAEDRLAKAELAQDQRDHW
jgi:hypothetical protein